MTSLSRMMARLCLISLLGWVLIGTIGILFLQATHMLDDILDSHEVVQDEGLNQEPCVIHLDRNRIYPRNDEG